MLWDAVARSQCLQSPGWGPRALKVFALADGDLRLLSEAALRLTPWVLCALEPHKGNTFEKHLPGTSVSDFSLSAGLGRKNTYSLCRQTHWHVRDPWVWISMCAVYRVTLSSFEQRTQACKPGDWETLAYLVSRGEGSIQFMQKCPFPG